MTYWASGSCLSVFVTIPDFRLALVLQRNAVPQCLHSAARYIAISTITWYAQWNPSFAETTEVEFLTLFQTQSWMNPSFSEATLRHCM
ncbi:hypothetical protein AHF37_09972 [Paragonimus kellicotti]|nr:hypothetical protein AHF37_09972 [Paragonimus kellicotti]